jgi:hypothetical protein
MIQNGISVGQSALLAGAIVLRVCKREPTCDMTVYFIHLQQLELPSLVLKTFTDLRQHIAVFVDIRQQPWTLADGHACVVQLATHLAERKKSCGQKL